MGEAAADAEVRTHHQHAEMLKRELDMIAPSSAGQRVMLQALGGLLERATIVFEAAAEKALVRSSQPTWAFEWSGQRRCRSPRS
jgi:hypothetical protein